MFLEDISVDSGQIRTRAQGRWLKNNDAAAFSLTTLIVLLHKFNSHACTEVVIKVQVADRANQGAVEMRYPFDDHQTFIHLFHEVKKTLQQRLPEELNDSLDVEWLVDRDKIALKYRIRMTPAATTLYYKVVFSSDPHSFFHLAFRHGSRYYKTLSDHALAMPNIPLTDLNYTDADDFETIASSAYGPVDTGIGTPELLDEIFQKTAMAHSAKPAVVHHDRTVTYQELNRNANRLAHTLAEKGVRRLDTVGLLLPRSTEAYAAMLGILKCGATYVPIDPDYPAERVSYILGDAQAKFLVSASLFRGLYSGFGGLVFNTDLELVTALSGAHDAKEFHAHEQRSPEDAAYIIYTSGSTGPSKGVVISHAAASNLIKAERSLFKIKPSFKVAQGFSMAFDASIEEIWMAFSSGASLYPVDKETMCSGDDVCRFIDEKKINILSTVPSLLSLMTRQVPTLQLLVLGGEVCPQELINRWTNKKLRIMNTYGPTEGTVITTATECNALKKNTIGKAIYNCGVFIVDSSLQPVPAGVPGELCIVGRGLATGYLNHTELTMAKFVTTSFPLQEGFAKRMYRSGDLARFNEEGEIEFLGRLDKQVKLRGYRVDLSEIESAILTLSNIKNAAVVLHDDAETGGYLVAYVMLSDKSQMLNISDVRERLRKTLAPYMVPSFFSELDAFPVLPSGKIDHKKLATLAIDQPQTYARKEILNNTERQIHEVWSKYFSPKQVLKHDDFFHDLGGHSMLAAKTVSALRQLPRFKNLSVLDVYKNPSISKLAKLFADGAQGDNHFKHETIDGNNTVGRWQHVWCGVRQFFGFYFVFAFNLVRDLPLFATFFYLYHHGSSLAYSAAWGLVFSIAAYPTLVVVAIAAKWVLLGRIKAGRYPLWGGFYFRWWLVRKIFQLLDLDYLAGTPLLPLVYRALGMRVGRHVHLETDQFAAFDLIRIGDGTSIDEAASLNGFSVKGGSLIVGTIAIGSNCFVGTRAVVSENTVLDDGARLEDLTLVPAGARIPAGETWSGSPARCASKTSCAEIMIAPVLGRMRLLGVSVLYCILFSLIPVLTSLAFAPGIFILLQYDPLVTPWVYLALLPIVGASFIFLLAAQVTAIKWMLVGKVKAGVYPVHGSFYVRNWIVDQLLRTSLDHAGQLCATVYVATWYRLLGMKIGRFVEVSTAASSVPDLVQLDEGSTVADEVSLGSPHVEKGWMTLAPARMGYRSFAGNSAIIPAGISLGDHSLIGVLSITPRRDDAARTHATWFGSAAILFPKREESSGYSEGKTYRPALKLRLARAAFEMLRVTLPAAASIIVTTTLITTGLLLLEKVGATEAVLALPVVLGLCCVAMLVAVASIKWAVMGKYKPFNKPLWSTFVWRLEFVNALYEFFLSPLVLNLLQGTPFLAWYLRMMGATIGKACYIDTTGFLEWDLVTIGDHVAVNENAVMQTHLFEDRILKASRLTVGNGCTIGANAVVLYSSEMKDGAQLGSLSLLMKGEVLPHRTSWVGIPAASPPSTETRVKMNGKKLKWRHDRRTVA